METRKKRGRAGKRANGATQDEAYWAKLRREFREGYANSGAYAQTVRIERSPEMLATASALEGQEARAKLIEQAVLANKRR